MRGSLPPFGKKVLFAGKHAKGESIDLTPQLYSTKTMALVPLKQKKRSLGVLIGGSGSPLCDERGGLIAVVSHNADPAAGQRSHAVALSNLSMTFPKIERLMPSFSGPAGCFRSGGRGRRMIYR